MVVRDHWQDMVAEVLQAAWLEEVQVPDDAASGLPGGHLSRSQLHTVAEPGQAVNNAPWRWRAAR
jgi:hypothetical protein